MKIISTAFKHSLKSRKSALQHYQTTWLDRMTNLMLNRRQSLSVRCNLHNCWPLKIVCTSINLSLFKLITRNYSEMSFFFILQLYQTYSCVLRENILVISPMGFFSKKMHSFLLFNCFFHKVTDQLPTAYQFSFVHTLQSKWINPYNQRIQISNYIHFSCTATILSKSTLSKPSIKQAFIVWMGYKLQKRNQVWCIPVKGWYIQPLVVTRRIRRTIQKWPSNSTKDVLIKQINCFFIERNPNKKSEFSLGEGAEYNFLHSSQSHLKNCFWSTLTESRPWLCIQNSHWFSLLLCVTVLVNVNDQNS